MTVQTIEQFRQDIGSVFSTIEDRERAMKSRDFHWYSPVLTPQLKDCLADVVVQPQTQAEIETVVAAAARHRIPITVRGGGTGNYGQAVPLQGGIVLDMTRFNKVLAVEDGSIRIEAGAYIKSALDAALATGQQLMMYPSTMQSAILAAALPASARSSTASSAIPA
jgi:FAD/FMN-containing dehydrogenase